MPKREEDEEEAVEITPEDAAELADAVRRIDNSMAALKTSGLSRRALVVLLYDDTKVRKRDINLVLDGLENLGRVYLEDYDATRKE